MGLRVARPGGLPGAGFRGDDHTSLSAMIHAWLRGAILNGTLAPGQVLRQEELAEQFRTSRVPLREALQLLQAEGLVVLRPRRGYAVHALDGEQLLELLRLRILLEGYGGYAGTLQRTQKDVSAVGAFLADMEKMPARLVRDTQRARWWTLDRQFHRGIFTAGKHTQLSQMFDNITAKIDPYLMHSDAMNQRLQEALDDHQAIYAAFARGDADQVAVLSRAHCERLAVRFAAALQQERQIAPQQPAQITDLGPAVCASALTPDESQVRRRRAAR